MVLINSEHFGHPFTYPSSPLLHFPSTTISPHKFYPRLASLHSLMLLAFLYSQPQLIMYLHILVAEEIPYLLSHRSLICFWGIIPYVPSQLSYSSQSYFKCFPLPLNSLSHKAILNLAIKIVTISWVLSVLSHLLIPLQIPPCFILSVFQRRGFTIPILLRVNQRWEW